MPYKIYPNSTVLNQVFSCFITSIHTSPLYNPAGQIVIWRISADLKECALRLWDNGWTIEDICSALMVSHTSIYHWQVVFDEHSTINPLVGRTRTLARALLTTCHMLFEEDFNIYLDEVVYWLAICHDIVISTSTLSRNLLEAGLTRKMLHKIAAEHDECLWQEWRESIHTNFAGDGTEFVWVDKTSKNDLSYACCFGRSQAGECVHLTDMFICGDQYLLVAALIMGGYIAAHVVEGSLDSVEF